MLACTADLIEAALEVAAQLAQLPAKACAGNKLGARQESLEIMKADLNL